MKRQGLLLHWIFSRALAATADQWVLYCVPILVYARTKSLSASGFSYAIEWLPRVASLAFAGPTVDRVGSQRVCLRSDCFRGMVAAIAFVTATVFIDAPFIIYAVFAGIIGILFELSYIGCEVSIAKESSREALAINQSWIQLIEQAALIVGPAIAVWFVSIAGISFLFAAASAFFFGSFLVISKTVRHATVPSGVKKTSEKEAGILSGLKTIYRDPVLRSLTTVGLFLNVSLGIALSLTPGYIQQAFKQTTSTYGMLLGLAGVVSVVTYLGVPWVLKKIPLLQLGFIASLISTAGMLFMGGASRFGIYAVGFVLLTVADGVLCIFLRTVRASMVPVDGLGSVASAMVMVLLTAFPLSGLAVGLLVNAVGGSLCLLLSGAVSLIAICLFAPVFFNPLLSPESLMSSENTA